MITKRTMRRSLRGLRAIYRVLSAPLRGLPSALIIGAQKGGTTSLFSYLVLHPDVVEPAVKEIHYFDLHYARGALWYRGQFPYRRELRNGALTVDGSPYYLLHPRVPERVARLLPRVRLIALLRNPIDRAVSHYHHEVSRRREPLTFEAAIDGEAERLSGEEERLRSDGGYYSYNLHRYSYLRRGIYVEQLRRWSQHFPRSQLLVVQSERFFRDPAAVMAQVHGFLGLRSHGLERYSRFLQGNYHHDMSPVLRKRLADYFEPHNRELYRWLGEEFDWA